MNGTIRYTIRPYDTIWMLAQVFNTTVDSIMELNPGIDPRNLMIGQVVTLRPGYSQFPSYSEGEEDGDTMDNENDMMDDENDTMDDDPDAMGTDPDELVNYFRMLWEQHVTWTRAAIVGIVHDLPETDLILQRLLRNPVDFANAFLPFYGSQAAQAFADLLTSHLTIAAELVRAAKAGDNNAMTDADRRWRENAEQIAVLLGTMNPYWSADDWSAMMNEHLDLLSANASEMIAGNYEESINGYDDIEMQALEMGDIMAEGIAEQFPG